MGGFDTHDGSRTRQPGRSDGTAEPMRCATSTPTLGSHGRAAIKVTTFTASDFGRTFTSNGDGTDHGWGGAPLRDGRRGEGWRPVRQLPRSTAPRTPTTTTSTPAPTSWATAACCRSPASISSAPRWPLVRPVGCAAAGRVPQPEPVGRGAARPGLHGLTAAQAAGSARRSCTASAKCEASMPGAPARSATVRATFSTRCSRRPLQPRRCATVCA